ncbi:MAG: ribosomal-protein-alanine N-acetyltransferase [Desulfuromonadaceae bacterium GWC2_58_13]|nr:MAG: ribosomal-protein-alanine N-acetyltransferase [Desulfuromonadaceae bacterium GWC2_58_13]
MGQSFDSANCAGHSLQYNIRPMEKKDLNAVVAAERLCYAHPWSSELFRQELDNPLSAIDLLFLEEQLAGYLCSWRICGELHIHNVATLPPFRRRGVAVRLIRHVMARCSDGALEKVFLEVRVGNSAAISLYRCFGFADVVVRKNYYPDGEDALLMELNID